MLTTSHVFSLEHFAVEPNQARMRRADPSGNGLQFALQLAESLESYLHGGSGNARLEIDVQPAPGGNFGARQFLVTVSGLEPSDLMAVAPLPNALSGGPITNEVDAYWATQPEEVQVLRTIDDPSDRAAMGQVLASQGFTIDPNIMIHRWDPYMTMKIRAGEGYTWVPAVGQDGIPVAPGLDFPGFPRYDPGNPPPGSVRVTTDFAKGLEHTSPGAGNTRFGPAAASS